jgi:Flp pilus assembly protein TadB
MSARVLTLVPIGVLTLLVATDDAVRDVITQPTGATVVFTGLALNAIGSWWMRRIVGPAGGTATT